MKKIKLIRIWYGVIILILVALLYEHTVRFDFSSILFWLRLMFLLVALFLTFYVVTDILRPEKAARRVEKVLGKEIRRKSGEIKQLKKEKDMFARSAMKQAARNIELKQRKS
ncbi:hypothetical protein ACFL6I_16255 [candidate division KSB1 bacterium]